MINADASERFLSAPWLDSTDREIKQELLGALAEERAGTGTVLLSQGQPNDHLAFLIEGTVELDRVSGSRRDVITTLTAPAVFGTTSFFQPRPPRVSVRAKTDVWLLTLHHPAYQELRRNHPRAAEALALAVVRALSERFDLLDQLLNEHIGNPALTPAKAASEWSSFRTRLFEEHAL